MGHKYTMDYTEFLEITLIHFQSQKIFVRARETVRAAFPSLSA
jgi:hypothetical protein